MLNSLPCCCMCLAFWEPAQFIFGSTTQLTLPFHLLGPIPSAAFPFLNAFTGTQVFIGTGEVDQPQSMLHMMHTLLALTYLIQTHISFLPQLASLTGSTIPKQRLLYTVLKVSSCLLEIIKPRKKNLGVRDKKKFLFPDFFFMAVRQYFVLPCSCFFLSLPVDVMLHKSMCQCLCCKYFCIGDFKLVQFTKIIP